MAISVDAGTSGLMSGAVPGVDPPLCRADVLSFLGVAGREMSPFAVALLVLLGEMAAGEGSQYKPYLDSLPLDSNCVWNWNEREAVELEVGNVQVPPYDRRLALSHCYLMAH
ncbi:unnamed protein product [Ostreobium quekettii]|uniref:Uncharacterized protein n=1 Tax=Ostreobium quekettii TaxID=121088 RepID=A0A8S1IRN0_9CHLO|nr:unnamed protein product [Ostreobium quekettii]